MQRGLNITVNLFILFFAHGLLFRRYPIDLLYPLLLLVILTFVSTNDVIKFVLNFKYYLLIVALSVLIGVHDRDNNFLRDCVKIVGNFLIFPAFLLSHKNRRQTLRFWQNVVFYILPIQIWQFVFPGYSAYLAGISVDIFRFSGPFVNPNITAMVVMGAYLSKDRTNPLISSLSFISIVLTESRSFLAAFLLLVFLRSTNRIKVLLIVASLLVLYNYWNVLADNRLFTIIGDTAGENIERSRLLLWATTMAVILERPLVGHGYGSMDYVVDFIGTGLGPHNFFLFVWGTGGILSLVFLLVEVFKRVNNLFHTKFTALVFIITVLMFNHDMLLLMIYPLMLSIYGKKIVDSH